MMKVVGSAKVTQDYYVHHHPICSGSRSHLSVTRSGRSMCEEMPPSLPPPRKSTHILDGCSSNQRRSLWAPSPSLPALLKSLLEPIISSEGGGGPTTQNNDEKGREEGKEGGVEAVCDASNREGRWAFEVRCQSNNRTHLWTQRFQKLFLVGREGPLSNLLFQQRL